MHAMHYQILPGIYCGYCRHCHCRFFATMLIHGGFASPYAGLLPGWLRRGFLCASALCFRALPGWFRVGSTRRFRGASGLLPGRGFSCPEACFWLHACKHASICNLFKAMVNYIFQNF